MFKLVILAVTFTASAFPADLTDLLKAFQYRNLGPWRTGAWVSALAVPETPPKAHRLVMFAGARTGGVWRTTNAGTTWEPVTDSVGIASVGAVAVAPSDANVVWVGTGDNSLTRSAYWGDGVYKSTDGGSSWANMGLRDTQHIARIVIHPSNPDSVWVAALGHLGTPNQERGVFHTTDGGRTWQKQLFVNEARRRGRWQSTTAIPTFSMPRCTMWPTGRSHAYPDRSCACRRTRLSGRAVAAFYTSRQIHALD